MHKICAKPFTELNCMSIMCPCCPAWLSTDKFTVNTFNSTKNASEIWEYDYAEFRNSILDGSYKYCSDTCPQKISLMKGDIKSLEETNPTVYNKLINDSSYIPTPTHLELAYDITCNLACKSCRPFILTTTHRNIDTLYNFYNPLFKNAQELVISGDGDAFASKHYFSLLQSDLTDISPNLNKIVLQTNGILLNEDNFNKIHPNNKKYINFVSISIDASTEETYKKVRGGNFNTLCNNLEFIKTYKLKHTGLFYLYSGFTISKLNIHEVINFIDFAYNYKFDMIQFWLAKQWDRCEEPKDNMERRYSDIVIDLDDLYTKQLLQKIHEKIDSVSSKIQIKWMIDDKNIAPKNIQKKRTQMTNTNPIINQDPTTSTLHITETIEQLALNNTPIDGVALYCPFYISSYNNASWITSWLTNVAQYETVPKFYSISYAPDINIDMYSKLIEKLNEVATCIQIKEKVFHTDALAYAHEYLKNHNFKYMVHIEQDVILIKPVVYHIINKMISDNSYVAITDIPKTDIFLEFSDIDISIFAINLIEYDNKNYSVYADTDNNIHNLISNEDKLIYTDVTCNTKLPILENYTNKYLFDTICELTKLVYKKGTDHWIFKHMDKLNIKNAINPVYIDSARGYPVHGYLNNKLSIVYNIGSCARHLFASRYHSSQNNFIGIDKIVEHFGYPPIGPESPNKHINIDSYYTKGIDIVIISKNQEKSLKHMIDTLRLETPSINRIFVLDRCTDGSKELLESKNEFFVERHDAVGFCAGSARNIGLKHTNPEHDVLFLDGDRIPHNLNYERIVQMLYYFNISMIKNKQDTRTWFVNVPSINTQYKNYNNNVWSSAILLRRSAIEAISNIVGNGNIFDPIFDGSWGCEDEYLGDVAYSLGMISGGFPSHIYVEGTTTPSTNSSDEYRNQVEKRNKLRSNLFNMKPELLIGNQPYLSKDERRELVNSIVSERRNIIRNMIKHRDRE